MASFRIVFFRFGRLPYVGWFKNWMALFGIVSLKGSIVDGPFKGCCSWIFCLGGSWLRNIFRFVVCGVIFGEEKCCKVVF